MKKAKLKQETMLSRNSKKTNPSTNSSKQSKQMNESVIDSRLLEMGNVLVVIIDDKYRVILVNERSCEVLGFNESEIIGKDWFSSFIPSIQKDKLKVAFDVLIHRKEKNTDYIEGPVITSSGKERIIGWHNSLLKNRNGEIIGVLSLGQDITDKFHTETNLTFTQFSIDHANDPIFWLDSKSKILYSNEAATKILGYSRDDFLSLKIYDIDPNLPEEIWNDHWNELKIRRSYTLEGCLRSKDEKIFPAQMTYNYFEYRGKDYAFVLARDITENRLMQEALKESEVRYRELFKNMNDGVAVYEAIDSGNDFVFRNFNSKAEAMEKIKKEEILGKSLVSVYPEIEKFGLLDVIRRVWATGVPEHHPITLYKDNRIEVWRENYVYKLPTGEIIAVFKDIGEQKKIELALRESEERYRSIFENSPISIWEEDLSKVKMHLEALKMMGIKDFLKHFNENPQEAVECARLAKIVDVNMTTVKMYKAQNKDNFINDLNKVFAEESYGTLKEMLVAIAEGKTSFEGDTVNMDLEGNKIYINMRMLVAPSYEDSFSKVLITITDITDRKKIEDKIRGVKEFYGSVLEGVNDGIWVTDDTDTVVFANSGAAKLFGVEKDVCIGVKILRDSSDGLLKNFHAIYSKAKEMQKAVYFESLPIEDENKVTYLSGWIIPEIKKGSFNGMICTIQDITERKMAAVALIESEKKYRRLVENLDEGIWVTDKNYHTVFVNQKMAEMLGYSINEMIGRHIFSFINERKVNFMEKHLANRKQGLKERYEFEFLRKDGARILTQIGAAPIIDNRSNYIGSTAVVMDITKRKLAEEESQFLSSVCKQVSDAVIVTDKNLQISFINEAAEKLYGYTLDELRFKNPSILNAEPIAEEIERNIYETVSSGGIWFGSHCNKRKDGSVFLCEFKISPLRNAYGEIYSYISVQTDITARKKTEEMLQKSLAEKEVLIKEVHHRVKNNLQVISSILHLQAFRIKDKLVSDVFKECQNRIKSISFVHEKLYNSNNLAEISFKDYVKDLADELLSAYGIDREMIDVRIDIEDVLFDIDTVIPCGLIVNEIISNSLKYAFPSKSKGEIRVELHKIRTDSFEFIIQDNGVGLPESISFQNTKSLGMRLVDVLIKQLKGEMKLDRFGGTKYTIIFKK
ncbi:MAG: PAS domain S-box protein [bacterium]